MSIMECMSGFKFKRILSDTFNTEVVWKKDENTGLAMYSYSSPAPDLNLIAIRTSLVSMGTDYPFGEVFVRSRLRFEDVNGNKIISDEFDFPLQNQTVYEKFYYSQNNMIITGVNRLSFIIDLIGERQPTFDVSLLFKTILFYEPFRY